MLYNISESRKPTVNLQRLFPILHSVISTVVMNNFMHEASSEYFLRRFPDWNYWVKEHDDYDSLTHIAKLLSKSCIYLQSTIVTIFPQHALMSTIV